MFANLFLLQHSSEVPELYLNSESKYRIFYELKRRTDVAVLNSNAVVKGFEVGEYIITFDQGDILISSDGVIREKYSVRESDKRPNQIIKRIIECFRILYSAF